MDSTKINEQENLVLGLRTVESLVEVCRAHKSLEDIPEGGAVSHVLMMVTNKVFNLAEDQAAILDAMRKAGES